MTSINNLSSTDTIYAGDLLPVWRTNNSDTRKVSLTTLTAYLDANLNPTSLSNPTISGTEPRLDFYETDGDVDEKRTTLIMDGGTFNLQTRTDLDAFGENFIRVFRTGTDVTLIQINAPTELVTPSVTGGQKTTGMVRAEGGDAFPASSAGPGIEVFYDTVASQAVLQGWNRTSSAFVPVEIRGSTLTIEPAIVDTVDIAPTANTYDRALNLVQTGPTSGSTAGPKAMNNIDIVVRSTLTGTGLPGDPTSATVQGFNVSMNAGGANFSAISAMAGSFGLVQTVADTSTGDKNGLSSGVSIAASTLGYAYGGSAGATVTATGSVPGLFGHEVNMFIYTGGTCPIRIGYHSMSWGEERASAVDAAFGVAMPGGGLGTTWGNAFVLSDGNGATPFPLHSTASVVKSFVAGTITNGIKLDNITFTGDLLHFPNFRVTAAGVVTGGTYNGATINENAWTTFTPTLSAGSGSITTSSASGRYRRLFGRTIVANMRATLTTVGTASSSLIFTLPVNADATTPVAVLHGREVATNGGGVCGTIQSATTVNCFFVTGTTVFAAGNGTIVDVSIIYEAAS